MFHSLFDSGKSKFGSCLEEDSKCHLCQMRFFFKNKSEMLQSFMFPVIFLILTFLYIKFFSMHFLNSLKIGNLRALRRWNIYAF